MDVLRAFTEFDALLRGASAVKPTLHSRRTLQITFPTLCELGMAEPGQANAGYGLPTQGGGRNQSDFLFFARDGSSALTLPAPISREAFCQILFKRIWSSLEPERAKEVVGALFERVLERACEGKAGEVRPSVEYRVGKNENLQLDLSARTGEVFVMYETKSKSLTAQARSGDMFTFYRDYCDSFLAMLHQLVRHEKHLRGGLTPLTIAGEETGNLRPLKVAVSPLSFGPVEDKMLASSLLRCFSQVTLTPLSGDPRAKRTIEDVNKMVRKIFGMVPSLSPLDAKGTPNVFAYLLDVFWLDLGQVLYALDRATSVENAFRPIQFMSFVTRDFWTEVAFADMQGLTTDRWRPVT